AIFREALPVEIPEGLYCFGYFRNLSTHHPQASNLLSCSAKKQTRPDNLLIILFFSILFSLFFLQFHSFSFCFI
ncbi:hypothetical protein KSY24_08855, partial [Bacteroides thetaiotaomicron]